MAGVKGRSGGARPGAGRKPGPKKPATVPVPPAEPGRDRDMLEVLQDVALGRIQATPLQVRAAIAAVQYTHAKKGEGGKKEGRQGEAEKVAGKFGARPAPLKLVGRSG